MILYYITGRSQFPGDEEMRRARLLEKISEAAQTGVDYIQLREKDLPARELESLAREAVRVKNCVTQPGVKPTRILINSRSDVALAAGADGVHLRSRDISPGDARALFARAGVERAVIAVSCHSLQEVRLAESHGADFVVFGPVFEGHVASPHSQRIPSNAGIEQLRRACAGPLSAAGRIPVLALGGVDSTNFSQCLAAGAAGLAGIRLFQENDLTQIVPVLRRQAKADEKNVPPSRRHPYLPG